MKIGGITDSYKVFEEKVVEEMGDIMWYLASIATIQNIELSHVLEKSIRKVQDRWKDLQGSSLVLFDREMFDDGYPEHEQIPRELVVDISQDENGIVSLLVNGYSFGDKITDNAYEDDHYRFHDVFHFAYMTVLGWSPVIRKLLGKKRQSDKQVDEVEDGGRAIVIDEAISAIVFEYARNHSFLEGAKKLDYELLRTITHLTRHLEVNSCSTREWEKAIMLGFSVWRKIKLNGGGRFICNLLEQSITLEDPAPSS